MTVNKNRYVIINIWATKKNKAGDNYPHISLTVHDGFKETYLSLWAGQNKPYNRGFSQSTNEKLAKVFSNFIGRPANHQQDYEQDCILEAFHQNGCRIIDDSSKCLEDETAYRVNSETHAIEKITLQSGELKPTEILLAITLAPANCRMVLYSLNVEDILHEMRQLSEPDSITGWTMVGSNLLTRNRNINGQTIKNSGALIFRCLMASGSLYRSRNLLLAIINTKIHEQCLYTGDAEEWKIAGETPWDDAMSIYDSLRKKVKKISKSEEGKYYPELEPSAPEKMPKIGYTQAREMLSQACERYLDHNQAQLGNLIAVREPDFENMPRKTEPELAPGFLVWVSYEYYRMWHSMLKLLPRDDLSEDDAQDCPRHEPIWQGRDEAQQIDPVLLLKRLNALFGLLQYIIIKANPEDERTLANYLIAHDPDYYIGSEQDPLSVKIHRTWKNLKLGIDFISTLPNYEQEEIILLKHRLEADSSTIDTYLKGRVVKELTEKLDDETLSNEEAVKAVELQLANPRVAEIVTKNRQSQAEQVGKILSVVSILIGVGIFITLGLVFKRLYDTGGSSFNFFKPLSKNLGEDLESLTQKTYVK